MGGNQEKEIFLSLAKRVSLGNIQQVETLLFQLSPTFAFAAHHGAETPQITDDETILCLFNVLGLLICLTPEKLQPESLCFLKKWLDGIIELKTSDKKEYFDIEEVYNSLGLEHELTQEDVDRRVDALVNVINSQCRSLGWNDTIRAEIEDVTLINSNQLMTYFIQSRTKAISLLISDLAFNEPLFRLLKKDESFMIWYKGLIAPIIYFDKYIKHNALPSYLEFEKLDIYQSFNYFISALSVSNVDQLLEFVIVPFLRYFNDWTPLNLYLSKKESDHHNLDSHYKLINQIVQKLIQLLSVEEMESVISIYLALCYLCPVASISIFVYMKETLFLLKQLELPNVVQNISYEVSEGDFQIQSIKDFAKLGCCSCNHTAINKLLKTIEGCEKLYLNKLSIKQMVLLSDSSNDNQTIELTKLITSNSAIVKQKEWEGILNSAYWLYGKTDFFSKIDKVSFDSTILNHLLELQLFDPIVFCHTQHFSIEETLYEESVFKKFYELLSRASNLNDKIGHLSSAKDCLTLLVNSKDPKVVRAKHLLKAISNLKNFKLFFESGVPITPSIIIAKNDVISLLERVLELNTKSYLAYDKLMKIMGDLIIGLDQEYLFDSDPKPFDKLKAICIESSLVDNNFRFAYSNSIEFIDIATSKLWLTFFQVGKYLNPEWDETPKDVLEQQLAILGKTLEICPVTDTKIVLTQWNSLNYELLSRAEIEESERSTQQNESSLESRFTRAIQSSANEVLNTTAANKASQQLSDLLVSGVGWAIGATPNK